MMNAEKIKSLPLETGLVNLQQKRATLASLAAADLCYDVYGEFEPQSWKVASRDEFLQYYDLDEIGNLLSASEPVLCADGVIPVEDLFGDEPDDETDD